MLLGESWNTVEHALRLLSGLTQLQSMGEQRLWVLGSGEAQCKRNGAPRVP